MVLLESGFLLGFGEHGRRQVALPLCAVLEHWSCEILQGSKAEKNQNVSTEGCTRSIRLLRFKEAAQPVGWELTSVRIRVLNTLKLSFGLLKQVCKLTRVANVAMALELYTDLDSAVSPDVSANAPIERVLEVSSVERLDVRLVGLRERRGRRSI